MVIDFRIEGEEGRLDPLRGPLCGPLNSRAAAIRFG
jgi:hypothetical protein